MLNIPLQQEVDCICVLWTLLLYYCYSINREALWFHMQKIGVSENVISCITVMHQDIKFCVKCGENHISSCALQRKKSSVKFVASVHICLFINDIRQCFDTDRTCS